MDYSTLAPDPLPVGPQILLCHLRLLGFDFARFQVPNDSAELGRLLRHPPKIAIVRLVSFLLGRLDQKRFSRFLEPLLLQYSHRVDVLVKNILFKWLKELPGNLKLTRHFSRFWSAPDEKLIYQFLFSLSSYVLQVIYNLEELPKVTDLDTDNFLALTEKHVSSFLRSFEDIHAEQKKTEVMLGYLLSQSESLQAELAHEAPCRKECLQYLSPQNVGSGMDDVALMNALSVYQEGEWKRLLALRRSVEASLAEWSRMSQVYLEFARACDQDPDGRDRCLKSTQFEVHSVPPPLLDYLIDQSVANSLRQKGALNLPNFLRAVEALFRRLQVQLCRGTTESSSSTSSLTEATSVLSSDILWCLNVLRRASQDLSAPSTSKSVASVDSVFPCSQASANLSGELCDSFATTAADVSTTLTSLTQKLRCMIAQEEADWCPSPLTLGRESGLSAEDSASLCYSNPRMSVRPNPEAVALPPSPSTSSPNRLSPNQPLSSSPRLARSALGELQLNLSVSPGCSQAKVAQAELRVRQLTSLANSTESPLRHFSSIQSVMASLSFNSSAEYSAVPGDENDASLPGLASTAHIRCSSQANSTGAFFAFGYYPSNVLAF
ncbi:hypothetical protein AAHC03_013122 [Spirometra sp. Aus1]